MSSEVGNIKYNDNSLEYYIYIGSTDSLSNVYPFKTEAEKAFDSDSYYDEETKVCVCGKEEEVVAYTPYGNGFAFEAIACKNCKSLKYKV